MAELVKFISHEELDDYQIEYVHGIVPMTANHDTACGIATLFSDSECEHANEGTYPEKITCPSCIRIILELKSTIDSLIEYM